MCATVLYVWNRAEEKTDRSACLHGIHIVLGGIQGRSSLGEDPESRGCLVVCRSARRQFISSPVTMITGGSGWR